MQIFEGQLRFGIHSGPQHTTFPDYLALWKSAEDLGLDWASVFDHFLPIFSDPEGPCFEGPTLLSALAAHTTRLRCGILVVGNTYRNPAVLANIAATIDHVSAGRLELGVGAGWFQMEHEQYGIPFHTTGRRLRMLGETLQVLKLLWTQERTTFEGRYYTLTEALLEPKPLQNPLPLWVGGLGEQLTLRVVAESADGWNTFFMSQDDYHHKLDVLGRHCKEVGRDPGDIRKSLVFRALIRSTEGEARAAAEHEQGITLAGTSEQVAQALVPYARELGVGDFLLGARPPADLETLTLFAKEVAPEVRRAAG
jgi:F420-dependent oxidoreductase-like protein